MKKPIILAWITLSLSLFAIVRDTNAISYNGQNTVSYPSSYSGTIERILPNNSNVVYQDNTACTGFFPVLPQSSIGGTYPIVCYDSGTLQQAVFQTLIEFPYSLPNGTYSLVNDRIYDNFADQPGRLIYDEVYNGTHHISHIVWGNNGNIVFSGSVATIDSWDSGGSFPDIIAMNVLTLYSQIYTGTNTGMYLTSTYDCFYHDSGVAKCNETRYEEFSNYVFGYLLSQNETMQYRNFNAIGPWQGGTPYGVTTQQFYQSSTGSIGSSDQLEKLNRFSDYFLPVWFGAISTTSDMTDYPGNGGGTGSTDYFGDCGSVLDVGCYIEGVWNAIVGFFDYLFPEISFSGEFNSCGTFVDGEDVGIFQRFANIIALINPIPPTSGAEICTIYGPKIVEYQAFIPEENLFGMWAPGVIPEVENIDLRMAFGQTPIDLIIIFGMMSVIFYQRSKHD